MNIFFLAANAILSVSIIIIIYEFIRPRVVKLTAQVLIAITQYKINTIKEQIILIKKHKNDHNLFTNGVLQEILWAFWGMAITCITIGIYLIFRVNTVWVISTYPLSYPVPSEYIKTAGIVTLQSISLFFFWRHLNKSLSRLLFHYQLVRDVIDYDEFIKQKTTEYRHLEKNIKMLWHTLAKNSKNIG